jgi:hypothetical protein
MTLRLRGFAVKIILEIYENLSQVVRTFHRLERGVRQ